MTDPNRRWFQFRLSFLLCLMGLMAATMAGYKFDEEVFFSPDPTSYPGYQLFIAALVLIGPIASGVVLLLGRDIVAIPMATGFLFSAAIGTFLGITVGFGNPTMLHIGFLLGAALGLVRLLSQEISPVRLLLGFPVCFCLGAWLVPIFATFP